MAKKLLRKVSRIRKKSSTRKLRSKPRLKLPPRMVKRDYAFVLYSPKTSPSGRALAGALISLLRLKGVGLPVNFGTTKTLVRRIARSGAPKAIVNLGAVSFDPVPLEKVAESLVLNPPEKIRASSNKKDCRVKFEQDKVPAPKLWLNPNIPPEEFPVIGRTTNHFKGHGFWLCNTVAEAQQAYREGATHFLKLVKNTREFRVHLFSRTNTPTDDPSDYVSIKLSEKLPREGIPTPKGIIKNHDGGWVFRAPDSTLSKSDVNLARRAARFAMASAKLNWGAVDVMVSQKKPYVLEINSSPALTDPTADTGLKYAEWVAHQLGFLTRELPNKPTVKPFGEAALDEEGKVTIEVSGVKIPLTKKERALLKQLLLRKEKKAR